MPLPTVQLIVEAYDKITLLNLNGYVWRDEPGGFPLSRDAEHLIGVRQGAENICKVSISAQMALFQPRPVQTDRVDDLIVAVIIPDSLVHTWMPDNFRYAAVRRCPSAMEEIREDLARFRQVPHHDGYFEALRRLLAAYYLFAKIKQRYLNFQQEATITRAGGTLTGGQRSAWYQKSTRFMQVFPALLYVVEEILSWMNQEMRDENTGLFFEGETLFPGLFDAVREFGHYIDRRISQVYTSKVAPCIRQSFDRVR